MSDRSLRDLCASLLLRAADGLGGDVYCDIVWDGYRYDGLDLLWDGPDRMVTVLFCWERDQLIRGRQHFLLFQSACGMKGIYKKFQLVLLVDPDLSGVPMDWPVGISLTLLPVGENERRAPSVDLLAKLASQLFPDEKQTAAALQTPPDWRSFITTEMVLSRIQELEQASVLPASLRSDTDALLSRAQEDPIRARELLLQYLSKRWRATQ